MCSSGEQWRDRLCLLYAFVKCMPYLAWTRGSRCQIFVGYLCCGVIMQVFNHGFDFMFFRLSKSQSGLINLLQLFMAEEEKVKVEMLIWKRKAFLKTFIYSLTPISLTLYVVFVSFVHVLNPPLNLSRSGGPRRLWGCSWTTRGPMQTLGSTFITCETSYLCYIFQVLPRRWCGVE